MPGKCSLGRTAFLLVWVFNITHIEGAPADNLTLDDWDEASYYEIYAIADSENGALNDGRRPGSATNSSSCNHIRSVPSQLRSPSNMYPRGLTYFYRKYTEAYGIPIVGSSRLSDAAIQRACYTVRFMFADRYAVRNSYYKRYGRFALIAGSELTTQIPEFSDLPPYWNTRARGFGATTYRPVSLGAEENALCWSWDKWRVQDIVMHEFAHGLHLLGALYAIPGFDNRLRSLYNSARSRGLWRNTYSLSTKEEYFAEGVQSYFEVQRYANPPDGINNHVDSREKLRGYDPGLYNIIRELFPCNNQYLKRCETTRAAELAQNIKLNCDGNGGGGGGGQDCEDNNQLCSRWASRDECQNNPGYMLINCKKSCRACEDESGCTDTNTRCSYWAGNGECDRNPGYMRVNCKKSCNVC